MNHLRITDEARKSRLVFVDPDDESVSYWWPAMIVPEEEFELFRETMDSDISRVGPEERLVCYFEDGSFAMVPFCPEREPFQSYSRNIRRFTSDLGVTRAVRYWADGKRIPDGFKWLLPRDTAITPMITGGAGGQLTLERSLTAPGGARKRDFGSHSRKYKVSKTPEPTKTKLGEGRKLELCTSQGKEGNGSSKKNKASAPHHPSDQPKRETNSRPYLKTGHASDSLPLPTNIMPRQQVGSQDVILSNIPNIPNIPKRFKIIAHLLPPPTVRARR